MRHVSNTWSFSTLAWVYKNLNCREFLQQDLLLAESASYHADS